MSSAPDGSGDSDGAEPGGPRVFQHPPWMVGVVLIFGVAALVAGLDDPIWLLVGSPFILALVVYLWVRVATRAR